jgi:hypothetical protein
VTFDEAMGHVMLRSTEEYLRLDPGRFRKPLAQLASTKALLRATPDFARINGNCKLG